MTSHETPLSPTRPRDLRAADVARLEASLTGDVVRPGDATYAEARRVWNGMIDRYPALVVRCASDADVITGIRFARDNELEVAVRAGGHNVAGFGTCDNGLVLDLSPLRTVDLDEEARTVRIGAGHTWASFDGALEPSGLHTTGGLVSTTGVAGFTLGGGIGWLMRAHGLACDNLVAADVVTADGRVVHTDEDEEPELLWGLRGGGGNFGVVTSMTFRVHPVSTVTGGLALFPPEHSRAALDAFAETTSTAPDEVTLMAAFVTAPPAPFVPPDLRGRAALAVACGATGDPELVDRTLTPLRAIGPAVDHIEPMPYTALQTMLDPMAPAGQRQYWKAGFVPRIHPGLLDVLLEAAERKPVPFSQIHLHHMGGAVARVAPTATAFAHRDAAFTLNVIGTWDEPDGDETAVAWARGTFAAAERWTDGVYVNFLGAEGEERVRSAYRPQVHDRLTGLKNRYDPENVFHLNQNIAP